MARFFSLAITLFLFTTATAQEYDPSTPEGYREHIRRAFAHFCTAGWDFFDGTEIPLSPILTVFEPEYKWELVWESTPSQGLVLVSDCFRSSDICFSEEEAFGFGGGNPGNTGTARDTHTCRELDLPPQSANLTPPAGYSYWGELPGTFTTPEPTGNLEVPGNGSFQSGIGFMSGWVCDGRNVEIVLNGGAQRLSVSRGVNRGDTAAACGDTDNGFITLWNWNLLGEGQHTAALVVDGQTIQSNTFTITTLGEEFIRGLERDVVVNDFPAPGETTRFRWQESVQGLVLVPD